MVDRTVLFEMEQMRSFDYVEGAHDVLYGLADLVQDLLGGTTALVAGLAATQTVTASLTINIAAGRIYQPAAADAVAIGAIAQDLTVIMQQGMNPGQQLTFIPPTTPGQSQWNLVQAQFSQVDAVRAGDPNGGVLPFYNAANPTQPTSASIDTVRQGLCVLQVITGAPATTGSEVPPTPTSGWVPLYLIDLANGQTTITNGEIIVTGPSVGTGVPTNYPVAPFLAGLVRSSPTLSTSHHLGIPGHAPKVNLGTEVQGTLDPATYVMGYQSVISFGVSGSWTVPAGIYRFEAELVGGGGGGGGAIAQSGGGGGGAGGYARQIFAVTPGQVITFVIGGGGPGGNSSGTDGSPGGTSSILSISAPGGLGGKGGFSTTGNFAGGAPGTGTGGGLVLIGGYGQDGQAQTGGVFGGDGGASFFGGGGRGGSGAGLNGGAAGSGGGGAYSTASAGGNGANGALVIRY